MKNLISKSCILALALTASAATMSTSLAEGHSVAKAQEVYLTAFGGVIFNGEVNTDGILAGAQNSVDADLDTSFVFGGAFGVTLPDLGSETVTPRLELEISHYSADVDEIEFSGSAVSPEINPAGDVSTTLILANAYLDFETDTEFTPFVGVGIGAGIVDFDFAYGGAARPGLREDDTGFAGQLVAGFSYDVTENVELVVDGRYSRVFDVESTRTLLNGTNTGTASGHVDNFAVTTGLRFKF